MFPRIMFSLELQVDEGLAWDTCEYWYHFDCDVGTKDVESNIGADFSDYVYLSCKELNNEDLINSLIKIEENMRDEVDSQPFDMINTGSSSAQARGTEQEMEQNKYVASTTGISNGMEDVRNEGSTDIGAHEKTDAKMLVKNLLNRVK